MDFYNQKWVMWFAPTEFKTFAITLGPVCFYSVPRRHVSARWRRHEDCHKAQYKRLWYIGFPFVYCFEYLRGRKEGLSHFDAYRKISFEIEARSKETGRSS